MLSQRIIPFPLSFSKRLRCRSLWPVGTPRRELWKSRRCLTGTSGKRCLVWTRSHTCQNLPAAVKHVWGMTSTQYCGKGWHGHSTPPTWPANSWDYTFVRTRFAAAALLSGLNNKSVRFRRRVVVMGYLWPQGRSARGLTPAYRVSTGRDKQGYYTFKVDACARGLFACQLFSSQPDHRALRNTQPSMCNNIGWLDDNVIIGRSIYLSPPTPMYYCGNQINTFV